MGNLLSVRRGLENCGAIVKVTADPNIVLTASKVVLPGVGSFANGMAELSYRGLDEVVREIVTRGTPLLGICLGMQMLLDESEEFGFNKGLGLISGRVLPIPTISIDSQTQKIPHIGWTDLIKTQICETWDGTILQGVKPGEAVYFVHSFMAVPVDPRFRIADCNYGGIPISSVIERENVYGCQFHPEKSGKVGLKILSRFLML